LFHDIAALSRIVISALSIMNGADPPSEVDRLKAELAGLPNKLPEPFTFDWKQVQASLGS
jgi:hypothetical protein